MTNENHMDWYFREYRTLNREDVTENTREKRKQQLERFRDWYDGDLADVNGDDILNFIMELSDEGYASTTISTYRWALSRFYRRMAARDRVEVNPYEQIEWQDISVATADSTRKKRESDDNERIHDLSAEEVRSLANNVPDPKIRNELLIRMLAQTGMRAHEIANLPLENVDRDNRIIEVIDEKTDDKRKVAYQPSLSFLLTEWIDGGYRDVFGTANDSPYLFVSRKSPKMDSNLVNDVVVQAAKNAGIQEILYTDARGNNRYKITAHQLRHTMAVQALKEGINIRYLQELLGHDKLETTEVYLDEVGDEALETHKLKGPTYVPDTE